MNKPIIIIVAAVVLILGAGYYFYPTTPESLPIQPINTTPPAPLASKTTPPATTETTQVDLTANGFSPEKITIAIGTTVKFVNKDTVAHWPASGIHPIHQVCSGLDALRPVGPGESYQFTFNTAKTCPVHDHLNPGTRGTIVVH